MSADHDKEYDPNSLNAVLSRLETKMDAVQTQQTAMWDRQTKNRELLEQAISNNANKADKRIDALEKWRANLTGRIATWSIVVGGAFAFGKDAFLEWLKGSK